MKWAPHARPAPIIMRKHERERGTFAKPGTSHWNPSRPGGKMVDLSKLVDKRPITLLPAAATRKVDSRAAAKKAQDTAGPAWFHLPAAEMTPEVEKDLRLIRMRQALDPKRHYKNGPILTSKYFQVGTVVAGADEYYDAGRLTRRERGSTVLDQLLRDDQKKAYFKKKFADAQAASRSGSKLAYKAKQAGIKKPWKK